MMSSHDSRGLVFKCLSNGAVDFLVKPIRKNELKNLWQHVWRRCHSVSLCTFLLSFATALSTSDTGKLPNIYGHASLIIVGTCIVDSQVNIKISISKLLGVTRWWLWVVVGLIIGRKFGFSLA